MFLAVFQKSKRPATRLEYRLLYSPILSNLAS